MRPFSSTSRVGFDTMRIWLLVGLVWMIQMAAASAISIITYDASLGSTVVAPNLQNPLWFPFGLTAGAAAPVRNDLNQGIDAWNVTPTALGVTPVYSYGLLPFTESAARQHGWRLKASARFVDDFGGYGGTGFTAFWNNRAYFLLFDLATNGALIATNDGLSNPLNLTPAGLGSRDYHDIELRWSPGNDAVEFWFDGAFKRSWTGMPAGHANTVQFGHFTTFGRGSMNYQSVEYEVGPFVAPPELTGDFNGDGRVDAADYLVWRNTIGQSVSPYAGADADGNGVIQGADMLLWKSHYGRAAAAAAVAAQPVPEPATGVLAALVAAWGISRWHGTRYRGRNLPLPTSSQ